MPRSGILFVEMLTGCKSKPRRGDMLRIILYIKILIKCVKRVVIVKERDWGEGLKIINLK
jgi:hypothetical protein